CIISSLSQTDPTMDMFLGVGHLDCAFRLIGDTLRSIKFRVYCRTAVSRVTHFTCSRNQLQLPPRNIDGEHSVPFPQDEIHFAVRGPVDGTGSRQCSAIERSFGWSIRAFPGSRKCRDGASLCVYFPDPIVHNVAN